MLVTSAASRVDNLDLHANRAGGAPADAAALVLVAEEVFEGAVAALQLQALPASARDDGHALLSAGRCFRLMHVAPPPAAGVTSSRLACVERGQHQMAMPILC